MTMLNPDANDTGRGVAGVTPSRFASTDVARTTATSSGPAGRAAVRTVTATTQRLLVTSVDDREAAQSLARALVDARLASCVQSVHKVVSYYRWQGEVCESPEHVLWIKTEVDHLPAIAELFRELHPYKCAEFVSIAPSELSAPFADWWSAQL